MPCMTLGLPHEVMEQEGDDEDETGAKEVEEERMEQTSFNWKEL